MLPDSNKFDHCYSQGSLLLKIAFSLFSHIEFAFDTGSVYVTWKFMIYILWNQAVELALSIGVHLFIPPS